MSKQKVDENDGAEKKSGTRDDSAPDAALLVVDDDARALVGGIVVEKLTEILPPIVETRMREIAGGILLEQRAEIARIVGKAVDDGLVDIGVLLAALKPGLPDLIRELMPESAEQVAAQEKAQAAQDASETRKAQAAREKAAAKERAKVAAVRAGSMAAAREKFLVLFGSDAQTPGFAVADVEKVGLCIDDGRMFCIDFAREVDAGQLVQQDAMIRLAVKIDLPADIAGFVVKGVSLHDGNGGVMRCEIPTPLHIGDGRGAHLAADSLVFRAPLGALTAA